VEAIVTVRHYNALSSYTCKYIFRRCKNLSCNIKKKMKLMLSMMMMQKKC